MRNSSSFTTRYYTLAGSAHAHMCTAVVLHFFRIKSCTKKYVILNPTLGQHGRGQTDTDEAFRDRSIVQKIDESPIDQGLKT